MLLLLTDKRIANSSLASPTLTHTIPQNTDQGAVTYETDVTARKPRSENARGLTTVGEAWDYMEQVHHAYMHDLYILSVRTSDP